MGPQQLSVTARRIRGSFPAAAVCQSRGGRTRRPGVGRKLSARPETQHPPVGGEVLAGPCRAPLPSSRPTPSGPVGVGRNHSPHEATDQPARRAKPSAPRSADRGSKPPPTVPAEAEVRCAPRRDGGVGRRHAHRGGRAPRVPPAPRACCVASPAADRRSGWGAEAARRGRPVYSTGKPPHVFRHLDTPDDPASSASRAATRRLDRRPDGRCMSETPARPVDELGIRVHPEVRRWT